MNKTVIWLRVLTRNFQFLFGNSQIGFFDKVKLKLAPRYKLLSVRLNGLPFKVSDAAGFVRNFEDIFIRRQYEFSESGAGFILDCGANVGLSVVYFKWKYPESRIVAFEPDPYLFNILVENINQFNFENVKLVNAAVWTHDCELDFHTNKGFSGSLKGVSSSSKIKVQAESLEKHITGTVDFLKLDIEGAEIEVLGSIKQNLKKVSKIYIEYHSFPYQSQYLGQLLNTLQETGFRYILKEEIVPEFPYKLEQLKWEMDFQISIYAYQNS